MTFKTFPKPRIVISKCLTFAKCRYNGAIIANSFIDKMKPLVEFIPVCPEVEIGLGIPRPPIRLVQEDKRIEVFQPMTGHKQTGKFLRFSKKYLNSLDSIDGFILKQYSPSCGLKQVKIYQGYKPGSLFILGSGYFANEVQKKFSGLSIDEDSLINNANLREEFLTKIFFLARFNEIQDSEDITKLTTFHNNHKFLFMTYSQEKMRLLGRIAANNKKIPIKQVYKNYQHTLNTLVVNPPKQAKWINSLMHMFGFISDNLSKKDKKQFLDKIEEYRDDRIPLTAVCELLEQWAIQFNNEYLLGQTIFNPYPLALRFTDFF